MHSEVSTFTKGNVLCFVVAYSPHTGFGIVLVELWHGVSLRKAAIDFKVLFEVREVEMKCTSIDKPVIMVLCSGTDTQAYVGQA